MPRRSQPALERPSVESWMIMPGQCFLTPPIKRAKREGSDVGAPSSLRTCACNKVAPASKAPCVDSTCSAMVMGTAGLSRLVGSDGDGDNAWLRHDGSVGMRRRHCLTLSDRRQNANTAGLLAFQVRSVQSQACTREPYGSEAPLTDFNLRPHRWYCTCP